MNECIQYSIASSPDTTQYRASFSFLSRSGQLSVIDDSTANSGGFRPGPGGGGHRPSSFVATHNFYVRQQNASCVLATVYLSVCLSHS